MAPTIHAAKLTLSCPLFAAEFDPRSDKFLLVGGGGGEGRSGSLLETSHRHDISEAVELDLSRDEDSVTSLAAAPQPGDMEGSLVALAGINSSLEQQKKKNNQHLRAFRFDAPRKTPALATTGTQKDQDDQGEAKPDDKKEEDEKTKQQLEEELIPGAAAALSRASLFRTKNGPQAADTYQRMLRLSPWRKTRDASQHIARIGAIATGLAPSGEIVFFRATETPSESDVIGRIRLGDNEEAEDIDFASLEFDPDQGKDARNRFRFAYTTGTDVMVGEISASAATSNAAPDVRCVYTIPLPATGVRKARPKFRALRFLSPTTLLLLQNAPDRGGSELVLLQLPTAASTTARILRRRRLPRAVKIALGLDICPLGTNPQGQQQTIIATSGSDHSISLWTLEYGPNRGYGLCFSTFIAPAHPITPDVGPQHVKLASVSMGNTVVVHTLPLSPFPTSSRTPRYVLVMPGPAEVWELVYSAVVLLGSLIAICVALLAFAEIRGGTPPVLGAANWLPSGLRQSIANEYIPPAPGRGSLFDSLLAPQRSSAPVAAVPDSGPAIDSLRDILDRVHAAGAAPVDLDVAPPQSLSVIVRCNEHGPGPAQSVLIETAESASVESESESDKLRAWRDLSLQDQTAWKRRLTDAGRWAASEGETVLQGVLFSEVCGRLGDWVREELP
ncbi:hypothetical protein NUU61_009627 [Penicillium alfredii]|uniref:Guanine nucleotide-exchange factor SEC12 n=1 Tax=Penicillium alfredii TaxID=1506179 RepID=A0A9W9EGG0_9EURO|nr:uncharacterized protein NUU61_009627 [Penicillium alfredii]KAJ5081363.1 hypothetical protein NUU61_009627 [Penicillium alfredii]